MVLPSQQPLRPLPWPPGRWEHQAWGAGRLCQGVQAAPDQAGLHPGRRGLGHGQAVWQRLLPDNHLQVWSPQPLLQKHVQAEAPAAEVARGCRWHRQLHHQPRPHVHPPAPRHDRQEEEEEDFHREQCPLLAGEGLPQEPQADLWGYLGHRRHAVHGEGGGQGLVLGLRSHCLQPNCLHGGNVSGSNLTMYTHADCLH